MRDFFYKRLVGRYLHTTFASALHRTKPDARPYLSKFSKPIFNKET